MSCDPFTQISRWRDGTGIVDARRLVESRDIARPGLIEALSETVSRSRSAGPLLNHLGNRTGWTGVLYDYFTGRAAPACGLTVVVLHQARVGHTAEGGGDTDAAAGFLEDDGEDEALVDVGASGDGLDGIIDRGNLSGGVIVESVLGA